MSREKNTKFSRHCELASEVVILQRHRNVVLYHFSFNMETQRLKTAGLRVLHYINWR